MADMSGNASRKGEPGAAAPSTRSAATIPETPPSSSGRLPRWSTNVTATSVIASLKTPSRTETSAPGSKWLEEMSLLSCIWATIPPYADHQGITQEDAYFQRRLLRIQRL